MAQNNPVEGWTDARYWSFIRSGLRRLWSKYPLKYKALNNAKRRKEGVQGKQKYEYQCACCSRFFAGKNVSVDHIVPAGSLRSYADLPDFCAKLFCAIEGLQVLCYACHAAKTNEERGIIPELAEFRKLKAEEQKKELKKKGLPEGRNLKERLEIITQYISQKNL